MLKLKGKDYISNFNKNVVLYQFYCYCDNSCIVLTIRKFTKSVKEHKLVCVDKFFVGYLTIKSIGIC